VKKFSLSKNERIKEKKIFEKLFKSGKTILSENKSLNVVYLLEKSDDFCVKVAVSISKKFGNSVWRNRLKRLIRNAYRLNKLDILEIARTRKMSVYLLFSSISINKKNSPKLTYKEIEIQVISLLQRLKNKIESIIENKNL